MLPRQARTVNTRIRWWQPLADDVDHGTHHFPAGWTLDDVFIGGSEINPSHMYQAFESNGTLDSVEFHPGGVVDSGICGKRDAFMIWKGDARPRSFTTEQLIIQDNYMLQFKVICRQLSSRSCQCRCTPTSWTRFESRLVPKCFILHLASLLSHIVWPI